MDKCPREGSDPNSCDGLELTELGDLGYKLLGLKDIPGKDLIEIANLLKI